MRRTGFPHDAYCGLIKNMRKPMSREPEHALNAICPYFTMFPLEFPHGILRYAPKDAVILDPFCGRGTTNYAARFLKRASYGIDSSPIAVAIAKAKLASASERTVLRLARRILKNKKGLEPVIPRGEFWRRAFHLETLRQLCLLREALQSMRSDAAHLLRGVVLGCLHGPLTGDVTSASYFSNQMPRTFASKPAYSVRYWREHRLAPRRVDVIAPIQRKLGRIYQSGEMLASQRGLIVHGDSTEAAAYKRLPDSFSHVVTSPPYYGLVTYVEDQWLRNWFLGGPEKLQYGNSVQVSHRSPEAFSRDLAKVWNHCGARLQPSGKLVIRFGSIASRDCDAGDILRASLEASVHHWRITRIDNVGTASSGKRQANTMGTSSAAINENDFTVRPV